MKREPEITHRIMAAVPSKNTRPEIILRKALWKEKMRYRIHYKNLPGKPDIVFVRYKIAVFCDGDFWHGHNWAIRGLPSLEDEFKSYSEFWKTKIVRNIEHDREVNMALQELGWTVIRFWESDIKRDLDRCVEVVKQAIQSGCE